MKYLHALDFFKNATSKCKLRLLEPLKQPNLKVKMFFERETLYLNNEKHLVNPSRPAKFWKLYCIEITIKLIFYFHTSLWCPKGLTKAFKVYAASIQLLLSNMTHACRPWQIYFSVMYVHVVPFDNVCLLMYFHIKIFVRVHKAENVLHAFL